MGLLDELFRDQPKKRNLLMQGTSPTVGGQLTPMLKGDGESFLRQQYPSIYGALGGLLGVEPTAMDGSILDPNTTLVREGASYGYPAGLVAQVLPVVGPAAKLTGRGVMAAGRAGERLAERVVPQIMERGGLPAEMLQGLAQGSRSNVIRSPGAAFDPRFDPRIKEQERLQQLITDVTERVVNVPQVSLADFSGRPFLTSMADRTGVGILNKINDVQLNRPVNMQGGQSFMFDNPGQVWASAAGPSKQILQEAEIIRQVTGQNPLFLPFRMAPTGGDFASMTGESMLSYADAAMNKTNKKRLDKMIKSYIPDWSGVSSERAAKQFRAAPDSVRKFLKNAMDVEFRDAGGLNIGEARLAVADPLQLTSRDTGLLSVGEVFADKPLIAKSGHAAYPKGIPGQGLGQLKEDISIFQLMPNVVKARGIPDPKNPRATDVRALQMKPYAGVLTDELLKSLGF